MPVGPGPRCPWCFDTHANCARASTTTRYLPRRRASTARNSISRASRARLPNESSALTNDPRAQGGMMEDKFDVILDANSPTFIDDLRAALGLRKGEPVTLVTPQFTRADGVVPSIPDAWEKLHTLSVSTLKAIGCGIWDEPDENGEVLMLFPGEWHALIPEGLRVWCIDGEESAWTKEHDDDIRYGCLAYGVKVRD